MCCPSPRLWLLEDVLHCLRKRKPSAEALAIGLCDAIEDFVLALPQRRFAIFASPALIVPLVIPRGKARANTPPRQFRLPPPQGIKNGLLLPRRPQLEQRTHLVDMDPAERAPGRATPRARTITTYAELSVTSPLGDAHCLLPAPGFPPRLHLELAQVDSVFVSSRGLRRSGSGQRPVRRV